MLLRILSHIYVFFSTFSLSIALKSSLPKEYSLPLVYAIIVDALFVLYNKASYPNASPGPYTFYPFLLLGTTHLK